LNAANPFAVCNIITISIINLFIASSFFNYLGSQANDSRDRHWAVSESFTLKSRDTLSLSIINVIFPTARSASISAEQMEPSRNGPVFNKKKLKSADARQPLAPSSLPRSAASIAQRKITPIFYGKAGRKFHWASPSSFRMLCGKMEKPKDTLHLTQRSFDGELIF
jgi:hypothetical protein